MEYKPERTDSYRFTIRLNDENDQQALANIRKSISQQNKHIKEQRKNDRTGYWGSQPILRVKVQFRLPELNHPRTITANSRGTKYGWGGSVRKDQIPTKADVYVYRRRE
jgi:(p)ppGpp synthase/HD superfamily hydrolase